MPDCPYWHIYDQYGAEYGISPELLAAISWYESGYNPNAKNGKHVGLFQLSTKWCAEDFRRVEGMDWFDPADNTRTACEVLIAKFEKYDGQAEVVLHSYHGEETIYKNPSGYAERVLSLATRFERSRGK